MKLTVAWIGKSKDASYRALTDEYAKRSTRYAPLETIELRSEAALLDIVAKQRAVFVALDARGKQMTSEELADFLRRHQERGTQRLLFAVGPADGFAAATLAHAFTFSLGKMTLAHELARVVLLEQLYRALTIIAGHPYHAGH
jgi:23S rRNA (pseudouridine1915-N3)-methyltransferase